MKTCLLCSSIVGAECATCPNCGEASFDGSSAMALPSAEAEPAVMLEASGEPEADQQSPAAAGGSSKPRGSRRSS